jgi:L-aspartate oxidase
MGGPGAIPDPIEVEVLVIGAGIAGATVALELADAGVPVTMVARASARRESSTSWAQGGIIYRGRDDSAALLARDIEVAGAGHCNPRAVAILAEEGPPLVDRILLERTAVPFDRDPDGRLALALEGGHGQPRIIHATDATGAAIADALMAAVRDHPRITLLTGFTAVDLLTPSHHGLNRLTVYDPPFCVGAYLFEQATGRVVRCLARQTVLATGGLGQIFLGTTNPPGARGDGVAMANRAGARVINMEFVQFHPTTFFHPEAPSLLVTEAVRGDGARLCHADGKPFMQRYDPERKDLAPRDVVARSIYREMLEHDLTNVYLDLRSYIPEARIRAHFPNVLEACLAWGVDITRDLVPVRPGAHYSCGGVWVDEWGRSTIGGLYAVGEVSCTGVHGANRLASTGLLEGLVWGTRAARRIRETLAERPRHPAADIPPWTLDATQPPDPALIQQDLSAMQHLMWHYVGLVRTTPRLARALRELRHQETEIEQFYRVSALTDGLIGLRNAVRTAVIVALAAWANKTSVGCHYRE